MKVHHIGTHGYESYMTDALCRSLVDSQGTPVEYKYDVCKKSELLSKIDNDYEVLILTGFALDGVEDTEFVKQIRIDYGVPFTEMFVVGSMNNLPIIPAFHEFTGNEELSAVKEFYDFLKAGNSEFIKTKDDELDEAIDIYDLYNTYTFTSRNKVEVLAQKHLADKYQFNFGTILNMYGKSWKDDQALSLLCNTSIVEALSYIDRHARWTDWRVIPLHDGEFLTLGVVNAEQHKNELAHHLISMSNTDKVAIVIMEDKGYTQLTIRTRNFDAVKVAREVDPEARGKSQACTVFTGAIGRTVTQIAGAFEAQLSQG